MLIRPHDAPIDSEREWRDLVTAHPFGHLIAPGKDREFPVVSRHTSTSTATSRSAFERHSNAQGQRVWRASQSMMSARL